MSEIDTGRYHGESLSARVEALSEPEIEVPDGRWGLGDLLRPIGDLAKWGMGALAAGAAAMRKRLPGGKSPGKPGKPGAAEGESHGGRGVPQAGEAVAGAEHDAGSILRKAGGLLKGAGKSVGKAAGIAGVAFAGAEFLSDQKAAAEAEKHGRSIEGAGKRAAGALRLGGVLGGIAADAAIGTAVGGPVGTIGGLAVGIGTALAAGKVADRVERGAHELQEKKRRQIESVAAKGGDGARDLAAAFHAAGERDRTARSDGNHGWNKGKAQEETRELQMGG